MLILWVEKTTAALLSVEDLSSGIIAQLWTYIFSSGLQDNRTGLPYGARLQSLWLLCYGGCVWGGFGLSAGWGFPWLGSGGGAVPLLLWVSLCLVPCVVLLCAGGCPCTN